ncbi:tyrosine-protein phosphatase [Myroides pelagicus]|uniref:tyrosine-protein phosphatase n=1 Tax=Myroides pelagicus TaxID=270914 RepID=UPI002DBA9D26|nr:tyrosine-protein phosphatase [Myroides pelagicus]MEC4113877.1 tyrosine-protein phosphatase [Myroides pelagicus]
MRKSTAVFFMILTGTMMQNCAYKTTYQTIEFSTLDETLPVITEKNKFYEGKFLQGDQVVSPSHVTIYTDSIIKFSKDRRPIVEVVREQDTATYSNRLIQLNDVHNFRDLGGIVTQQGRSTKWGMIYRSGHLHKLKKREEDKLLNLGIRQVIDLRTDREIKKKADHLPKGIEYVNYQAYEDSEDMFTKTRKDVIKGNITPEEADALVVEFYKLYPLDDLSKVREIVFEILDNDEAILFHCSAGKDRTGMIGAILLSILDVNRAVIIQEYMLSNNYRKEEVSSRMKLAKFGKMFFPRLNYQVVENFSWVKPIYIEAMFDAIEGEYGSMESYIQDGLGIDDNMRQKFLNRFTH